MSQKHLLRSMGLLFLAILILMLFSVGQAQESVFRIGVLDSERGPISSGARLAVRDINNSGGVTGPDGATFRLELIIVPGAESGTLDEAVDVLADADVLAVLGPESTEAALSGLPLLQSLGVPILTPALGDTLIASDSTGMLFRSRAPERLMGSALASYLVNDLSVTDVTTVQLDRPSTASRVGFSFALGQIPNAPQENTAFLEAEDEMIEIVSELVISNPPSIVVYGDPLLAAPFYVQLRDAGWVGKFAYDQALDPVFIESVPLDALNGILSQQTWTPAALDTASTAFVLNFTRAIGRTPGPVDAASYDAINLIADALGQSGSLSSNLSAVRNIPGVQGLLNPPSTEGSRGETGDNVFIVELNPFGGARVVARYAGSERLAADEAEVIVDVGTPTPTLTPTPEGLVITILSAVQNVRTGPGLEYEVLGQLREGEQARVIGATTDFSWVVIEFRGQQGWLATYLLDVFGDRRSVPVVSAPPTPTPGPATSTPTPPAIPDLVVVSAQPATITRSTATNVVVVVRNQGGSDAGGFAVAATFPPNDTYSAVNVPGLAAGTETTVNLPVNLSGATGLYEVGIVADLNRQVDEGPNGETNNILSFNFKLDQQLFLINSTTLGSGASIDLDPGLVPSADIQYTAAGLQTMANCDGTRNCIGLISPTLTWDTSHYDAITGANGVNTNFIPNAALTAGATVGVLTQDGLRGVLRVDAIQPGVSITFTYRIYQAAP